MNPITSTMSEFGLLNYKGVMLCNRPSDNHISSSHTNNTNNNNNNKPAFKAGSTLLHSSDIGLPPTNTIKIYTNRKQRKDKHNDVTYKHKQWLKVYQKQCNNENNNDNNNNNKSFNNTVKVAKSDDIKKQYLTQSQQSQHSQSDNNDNDSEYDDNDDNEQYNDREQFNVQSNNAQQQQQQQSTIKSPTNNDNTTVTTSINKPKWAMTTEEIELLEEKEADELLNYTANLDFKSYISDIETENALKFVKDRIKQLEEQAELQRKQQAKLLQLQQSCANTNNNTSINMNDVNPFASQQQIDNDYTETMKLLRAERDKAEQLENRLYNDSKLRIIHSTQSIKALIEQNNKTQQHNNKILTSTGQLSSIDETIQQNDILIAPQPLIVVHDSKQTTIERKKTIDASNLPYLYRHPGI